MKWETAKNNVKCSIGKWGWKQEINTPESMKKSNYIWAISTCGTVATKKNGKTFPKRCHSPLCSRCTAELTQSQAKRLLDAYPDAQNKDFRSITIMLSVTIDISQMYKIYNVFRSGLRPDLDKLRRSVKPSSNSWKQFGIMASMEVDVFSSKDFHRLGTEKKKQLTEELDYIHFENSNDGVYSIHIHAVCIGMPSDRELYDLLIKHSKSVHIEPLKAHMTKEQNIHNYLAYSSIPDWSRELPDGTLIYWTPHQIEDYANAVLNGDGRKSHKFEMLRVGFRKSRSARNVSIYKERTK